MGFARFPLEQSFEIKLKEPERCFREEARVLRGYYTARCSFAVKFFPRAEDCLKEINETKVRSN